LKAKPSQHMLVDLLSKYSVQVLIMRQSAKILPTIYVDQCN